jgi:hypothetical protein
MYCTSTEFLEAEPKTSPGVAVWYREEECEGAELRKILYTTCHPTGEFSVYVYLAE